MKYLPIVLKLLLLVILFGCSSAGDRLEVAEYLIGENPLRSQLIGRVKEYYSYLENQDFGEIYDLMSEQVLETSMSKTEFIDYLENDTYLGKCKWSFASLEIKSLILEENKAYVGMEYSIQEIDTFKHKYITYPKETWWDEWVFEDDNWKLYSFLSGGYRPKDWPKD